MTRPKVIVYNATSLDGRNTGFPVDLGLYYGLVSTWKEHATLAGSGTILKADAEEAPPESIDAIPADLPAEYAILPVSETDDERGILVVPDSRGRVKIWHFLRSQEYWRGVLSLCTESTPPDHIAYLEAFAIPYLIVGADKVDYPLALEELNTRFGVETIRVDSGGTLNGILISQGLVDEVSVLLHPTLAGGDKDASRLFIAPDGTGVDGAVDLELLSLEPLEGGIVWFRYGVV